MDKQAQGNTFWVIIGAVIALVVLVVLLVIFTGKTGEVSKGLLNCEGKGGICVICDKDILEGNGGCSQACEEQGKLKGYDDSSYSSIFSCREGYGCCLGVKKTS